jgi:hypothetical protein
MGKKLPIGLQDFRKIIENGFKYVDKTAYIHQITQNPGAYFLARPRRFGKSITIAVLHELYNGSRELFSGLWIEDKWDWSRKNPVIRISLKDVNFEQLGLEIALSDRVREIGTGLGATLHTSTARDQFREIIQQLGTHQKVVVLIDEYDAPIVHYLGKEIVKAYENRELLKGFYSVLKELDRFLELVFITGVSKFSKVGIFSGMNNLNDLTLQADYATMLGYTQEELESNFAEEIETAASKLNIPQPEILEKLREWYNGYRFHASANKVYNPVSVNLFFNEKEFKNFWFTTGTPSFLVNLLKKEGIYDLHFPAINPGGFESFELDHLKLIAILFQTGYLTIQHKDEDGLLQLDYPNKEVRDSMLEILIEGFVGVDAERSTALVISIRNAFRQNNLEQVFRILQSVFNSLPYSLYEKYPEKFFHAAIHLLFTYMGIRVHSEVCTSDGRVDSLVETDTHVYILEFKLDESPQIALEQIKHKKYYQPYWLKGKTVIGVGVNFSGTTKNIDGWVAEDIP